MDSKLIISLSIGTIITIGVLVFGLPIIIHQSYQIDCLHHGFFDYDSSTKSCYEMGHTNVVSLEKVKAHNILGSHCDFVDDCRILRSKLK